MQKEEIRVGDLVFTIHQDECEINPRKDWDNFGTIVCFHKRYDLGDEINNIRQEDFAAKIGRSQTAVSFMVAGKLVPGARAIRKIEIETNYDVKLYDWYPE